MRIRRRPQGQPLPSLLLSDPSEPQPPPNASRDHQERPAGAGDKKEEEKELHLHPNAATDLGAGDERSAAARRAASLPLLPQDNVVERGRSLGAQQQGPAADGHKSLENGHHHVREPVIKAVERLSNGGGGTAMPVTTTMGANAMKQLEMKDDSSGVGGVKKRRGSDVLMEGSRCSRKNGRGWRCSQQTLVGYALCQYHLGKGRMRSAAAAAGRGGASQLGRTENGKRASAAVRSAPKADVPPPSVQHC